jgi:hypothetical protein
MNEVKTIFGHVRAIPANVEETRTVEFVISNNTKDRHRTVLPVDKWQLDRFNANPIVGYQHNVYGGDLCNAPDPDQVIGRGRAWVEGDQLIGSVTFEPAEINPLAEKIFRKVLFGTLSATSVGFNSTAPGYWGQGEEAERGSNPTYYFDGQELLEFSIVNIPSNPEALKRSMRDQATNAISYLYRQFGGEYRFADIENMTVGEVIRLLETRSVNTKGVYVKVEVEIDTPEDKPEDMPVDEPLVPTSDQVIDRMNEERESDNDLILLANSKLAVTANL